MTKWTQDQRAAIESRGTDLLLAAAAGSGKTTVLVERVATLLQEGADVRKMLIVTFTRAAAADMRMGLIRRLTALAGEDARFRQQAEYAEFASISTIHSFCSDLLRANFQAAGVDPAFRVLDEAARLDGGFRFEFTHFPWGCEYYRETGRMMPEDGMEQLSRFDAIFLGAVGAPGVPDHVSLWDLLLTIRKGFDQYINLRPVKLLKGAPCPLKDVAREDVDMVFVRENS